MPAQAITELFNGGIVTARHPALLREGELQRADDCVYREKDPAIWRAPGRTQYGTVVSGSPVLGLAYLPFENRFTSKVLAYSGVTLYSLNVADTGTETSTEVSGPLAVSGTAATVSTHTEFTAAGGAKPFLAQIVGARVFSTALNNSNIQNAVVSDVIGTPTGNYYPGVRIKKTDGTTVSATFTPGTWTIAFQWGVTQTLDQDAVARNNILDVAQFGSSYFSWFGFGEPRKIEWLQPPTVGGTGQNPVLSQRPLGLSAVTDPITLAALTGTVGTSVDTYAWRSTLGTGFFWFLVTEIYVVQTVSNDGVVKDVPGSEVESAYLALGGTSQTAGEPVAISVPNLTTGVRVILPAVRNQGQGGRIATHWGIYMCPTPTADAASRPSLATFRRIKRVAIKTYAAGSNVYNDPGTVEIFETTGSSQALYASSVAAATGGVTWQNDAAMLGAPDGTIDGDQSKFARGVSNSSVSGFGTVTPTSKLSFTINAAGNNANREVTGIGIRIWGRANSSGSNQTHAECYLYPTLSTGAKDGFQRVAQFTNNHNTQVRDFGGPGETWGVSWGLFSGLGTFGVIIGVGQNDADMTCWIDAVGLTLFGTTTTIDVNGKPYRCVVYRDQVGTTIAEPAYGLPPSCSCACFFQGMFVTDDLEDKTALRYSLPGYPEYFPRPYVMRLNSGKRRDEIKYMLSLGQLLVVGLENSIERVNYLPREVNTDLQDGLAHEELTSDHGIPGPQAAVKFDMPEAGTMIAYASSAGVFLTNGIWIRPMNMDLDWPNTVKLSALSSCVFRVYPREKWLVLYYCPAGASHDRNTRALVFSYAADKVKNGGLLPCTGPLTVSARASTEMILTGSSRILTGHETTGIIYKEDSGTTQASGYQVHNSSDTLVSAPILPLIRTRRIYAAGIDRDGFEDKIHILFSAYGSNSVTATPTIGGLITNTQTKDSTTIQSNTAVFNSVLAGMRITGTGIDPNTVVLSVAGDFKSIVLSRAVNTTAAGGILLTFDTGTIGVTVRGAHIIAVAGGMKTAYASTLTGDLVSLYNANIRRGFEFQIEKVPLTFDSNGDTLTWADLSTNMRLHQFSVMMMDGGPDTNRATG